MTESDNPLNSPTDAVLTGEGAWVGLTGSRDELEEKTRDISESPGVYVFRGESGEILYVGKAKNLRKRLRSYFSKNLSPKTSALMERVFGLETITVNSEVEALILESNLVKKHKPRYNIRLRDDKQYPYLRVSIGDEWPKVTVVRRMQKDGARYFGPFTRPGAVRETLSTLRRIFPYRNCSDKVFKAVTRPCLDYYIGRCLGPCTGKVDRETYMATISETIKFLEGRHQDLQRRLEAKMLSLAENLDFEAAARVRDQIRALDDVTVKQRIISPDMKDRDVLGLARTSSYSFVALLPIREGKLLGREGFVLEATSFEEDEDVLEAFISQYYSGASYIPPEILVPCDLTGKEDLEKFLQGATIKVPKRGDLSDLILLAGDNARTMLKEVIPKKEREVEENLKAMKDLAQALGLETLPHRIEGYDISSISGKEAVASMVVLTEGKPDKSSYKRFKMRIEGKPDDFAMMQEVLWRRFKRGFAERQNQEAKGYRKGKFSLFPDLILLDGGKGQVSAGVAVLKELGLDIPLFGLAKKHEEIFLPDRSEPLILPRDSGALYLIMRLRDEAHRFALSYHRKLRTKKMTEGILQEIHGLGPARIKELLKTFGSVEGIRKASFEDLAKVKGIGPEMAGRIKGHLGDNQTVETENAQGTYESPKLKD